MSFAKVAMSVVFLAILIFALYTGASYMQSNKLKDPSSASVYITDSNASSYNGTIALSGTVMSVGITASQGLILVVAVIALFMAMLFFLRKRR